VKTHIHNIYAKLGAENRVMAVARARSLELL
jgi:ATP/maltotriose-dependent transcriptional regulator MalT